MIAGTTDTTTIRGARIHPGAAPLLDELDLEIRECVPISRSRPSQVSHYLIEAEEGRYFLKVRRPSDGTGKRLLRSIVGSPSFERQITVHRELGDKEFRTLRFPRLVRTDEVRYVLLDYISGSERRVADIDPDRLIDALVEFQHSGVALRQRGVGDVLLDVALDPTWFVARSALTRLRRHCGTAVVLDCLRVLVRCHRRQRRLGAPALIHNDFHPQNVLVGHNDQIYLMDFENATLTRKWLFTDIVHFAVKTDDSVIDTPLIQRYRRALEAAAPAISPLNVKAQVRFALLRRVIQHVTTKAAPKDVRDDYADFLTGTLLPDAAFEVWYANHLA